MTNLKKLLGINIRILRKSHHLSQSELAEMCKTSTNYISSIETGRRFPSLDMMEKMAIALEVDTVELFYNNYAQKEKERTESKKKIWKEVGENIDKYISSKIRE